MMRADDGLHDGKAKTYRLQFRRKEWLKYSGTNRIFYSWFGVDNAQQGASAKEIFPCKLREPTLVVNSSRGHCDRSA